MPSDNMNDLIDKTLHTLENSIHIRLRADVPLAVSLSSGLDSSSIASLTQKHHPNITGFSFSHPQNKKSEGPLVEKCAKFINIPVEYVWPNDEEMINAFFKTIEVQDAPFSSLSVVAQHVLYQRVNASHIKVLLGGQGGDEAFMGYKKFLLFSLKESIKNKNYWAAIKKITSLLPNIFAEIPALTSYWKHRHRYKNNGPTGNTILNLPELSSLSLSHSTNDLWKRQLKDIQSFSLPTLMRYEDRNAMSHSVESRLPFMDHRLIELALALPETLKLKNGYGKWIIRKIMFNKIPSSISLARFKRGFDLPIKKLIDAGLGHSIRSTLIKNPALCHEFIKQPQDFKKHFSNAALLTYNRLHESIILLWLNKYFN
jgi:asparagine synthase (glutamine-hydrolysing)